MYGWLVYNKQRYARNAAYAQMHADWCRAHDVELVLVFEEDLTYGVGGDGVRFLNRGARVLPPDFAIFRCEAPDLRRALEATNVLVANSSRVGNIANDKIATYLFAASLGVRHLAVEVLPPAGCLPSLPFPLVVKPRGGHGGAGVRLLEDAVSYEAFMKECVKEGDSGSWLAQRVCDVVGKDLRVYVMGTRVLAAMLRTAPEGELRSNYCLGGRATPYELSGDEHAVVKRVTDALGQGYYGIDFMFEQNGGFLLNEVEDVVGSRMLYAHTAIDVVDAHLKCVTGLVKQRRMRGC